jgi:hypothetical protein
MKKSDVLDLLSEVDEVPPPPLKEKSVVSTKSDFPPVEPVETSRPAEKTPAIKKHVSTVAEATEPEEEEEDEDEADFARWLTPAIGPGELPPPALVISDTSESQLRSSVKPDSTESSSGEEMDESDKDEGYDFAKHFRSAGDEVFDRYWYPLDTVIPRLTLESRLMATFKVSIFERLKGVMLEKAKKEASDKLKFVAESPVKSI